ncbi:hypothetical protein BC833DRAFT_597721 [Globomyces pollinis-pini]|nr:hypothetical protein BC833DRAFT_597721 [Globomyces pollinis-pini]
MNPKNDSFAEYLATNPNCVLFAFDLSNEMSFELVKSKIALCSEPPHCFSRILLVGNNPANRIQTVSEDEIHQLAKNFNCTYVNTSIPNSLIQNYFPNQSMVGKVKEKDTWEKFEEFLDQILPEDDLLSDIMDSIFIDLEHDFNVQEPYVEQTVNQITKEDHDFKRQKSSLDTPNMNQPYFAL